MLQKTGRQCTCVRCKSTAEPSKESVKAEAAWCLDPGVVMSVCNAGGVSVNHSPAAGVPRHSSSINPGEPERLPDKDGTVVSEGPVRTLSGAWKRVMASKAVDPAVSSPLGPANQPPIVSTELEALHHRDALHNLQTAGDVQAAGGINSRGSSNDSMLSASDAVVHLTPHVGGRQVGECLLICHQVCHGDMHMLHRKHTRPVVHPGFVHLNWISSVLTRNQHYVCAYRYAACNVCDSVSAATLLF